MNVTQRIIKYIAIAFGIFLAFNIIAAIVMGVTTVAGILIGIDNDTKNEEEFSRNDEVINIENVYDEVTILDINLAVSNIQVLEGSQFKVIVNSKKDNITIVNEGNTLTIAEKENELLKNEESFVTVYVPRDYVFNKVNLKNGAGNSNIEYINSNILDLELGVGEAIFENIVAKDANIQGGVGTVNILNFNIDNLDLETGIGKFKLDGKINQNANINCGVGKVELRLLGDSNDYSILTKIGIGSINIANEKCSNNSTYGSGNVKINVTGGIGKVDIEYIDNI